MEQLSVYELVRKIEEDDKLGTTQIGKYVSFNQRENLEKIDAYLNSKHTSGEYDSQDRKKPFFNIVIAAVNIWFRATDIDRKNITIKATRANQYMLAFVATVLLQNWMRKHAFGRFLNDWGIALARYGSAILKFVEKEKDLHCEVMPWNRMLVDPVDFENNLKVEKLWFTPAQLLQNKTYNQEFVKKLIEARETRKTTDNQSKDTKEEYIPVYELHGELPLSYLTEDEEDDDEYIQQMHAVSFVEKKDGRSFDEYTLYAGREKKNPYMLTHLIKEDGRTQSIGAVEHLFQAQWQINQTIYNIKNHLDLASKLIFQTSDGNFIGQNALNSIQDGQILVHKLNEPLTNIYNKADIAASQSYGQQWKTQANEIAGISEAMLGAAPKSGTAWRQTEALLQESHNLFEIMTENKGLDVEEMLTEYIIPHLKKQMDTSEEIMAILEDHQITQFDSWYVPRKVIKAINQKIKDTILSGRMFFREQQEADMAKETEKVQETLSKLGNQRPFNPSDFAGVSSATWKEVLKDLEWEIECNITGEQKDTQAILTTLSTVFQTIASNPMALQDPNVKLLFNKILENTAAVSPIELKAIPQQPPQQQIQPPAMPQAVGKVGAGTQPQLAT